MLHYPVVLRSSALAMASRPRCELSADAIFAEALHDKKRAGDTIDLVIPHGIGRCSIDRTPLSTFHELIAEGLGQEGDASAC